MKSLYLIGLVASGLVLALSACSTSESRSLAFDPGVCRERAFDIYFDEWQVKLSVEAKQTVRAAQAALKGCAIKHVKIVGLADSKGDKTDNVAISLQRAETIARSLHKGGWSRDIMELVAVGEKGATNDEGFDKPMRRRAHVTVDAVAP